MSFFRYELRIRSMLLHLRRGGGAVEVSVGGGQKGGAGEIPR
jgi:CO dehydrogenase/acetyl-CoA synthase gamma subunit (corrinoid Fe-S protein)